jgi:valyl-tRNA synthetase
MVVHSIYDFFWRDFCDYYLELVKPRLYAKDNDSSRRVCQGLLVTILEGTLRLLHPVCPFITEELWSAMKSKWGGAKAPAGTLGAGALEAFCAPHLMVAPWLGKVPESYRDEDAERDMQTLQQVIHAVRNVRGELKVPPGTPANVAVDAADERVARLLRAHEAFFRTLSRVSEFRVGTGIEPARFSASANLDGITVHVELPEDLRRAEIDRLRKERDKTAADRARQEAKLTNESFVSKAPPAVIQKEREKLARLEQELASLCARLQKMES